VDVGHEEVEVVVVGQIVEGEVVAVGQIVAGEVVVAGEIVEGETSVEVIAAAFEADEVVEVEDVVEQLPQS
jgi:hypothetical protein